MTSVDANPDDFPPSLEFVQTAIKNVAHKITSESIVKMVFLFSDLFSQAQCQLLLSPEIPSCQRIFCLVRVVLKQKQLHVSLAINIWAELLFLTKNYSFLNALNTCKHIMKEQSLRGAFFFSSEFRRLLVSLADDLTDDDVHYIWRRLHLTNTDRPKQPELLFQEMMREQLISQCNIQELSVHFGVLNRPDLLHRTQEYSHKLDIRSRASYDLELVSGARHCGLALIFNNKTFTKPSPPGFEDNPIKKLETREGTDKDANRLVKLWEMFGIRACKHDDADSATFDNLLKTSLRGDLSTVKIFIVCVLSHGNTGLVYFSDRVPVEIDYIEELLGTCEKLAGIPKLLFIQACQGDKLQKKGKSKAITEVLEFDARSDGSERQDPVPQFCDMLIGMSTVPGFGSLRLKTGSHYIQSLVDVFETSGDKEDISMLVPEVNSKVTQKWADYPYNNQVHQLVQMPSFRNQLTKRLMFKKAMSLYHRA